MIFFHAAPALAAYGFPGIEDLFILSDKIKHDGVKVWFPRIAEYTISLMWFTSMVAFFIGYKDIAFSGGIQLESIVALFVRIILTTGLMIWLLSVKEKIVFLIPDSIEHLGGYITTGNPDWLSYDSISIAFKGILDPIVAYYETLSFYDVGLILVCIVIVFFINCLAVLFITTVLLVRVETMFILIGGMFTAAFFVIGYFRDIFMGYIKALAMNGLKLLLLTLCLSIMDETMKNWQKFYSVIDDPSAIYDIFIPITCSLMAFYIIIKTVPQYAVAIFTGHATADGSYAKAAAMAGIGTAAAVYNISRNAGRAGNSSATAIHNAAQAHNNVVSPVKDAIKENTGGNISNMSQEQIKNLSNARRSGSWEAAKSIGKSVLIGSGGSSGRENGGKPTGGNNGGNKMEAGQIALLDEKYKNKEGMTQ